MIAHNMPPRGSNTAPRRLQVAKEPPKEAPERPKPFKHIKKINVFGLLPFSLPMLLRPQDGPKMAQEGPKRIPRQSVAIWLKSFWLNQF